MPIVHVVDVTPVSPERVLEAARDFSSSRAEFWPDVHVEHLWVHETGENFADVTEGNPWPIGFVWERLSYDWSEPGAVRGVVIDSNLFRPGSTWEIRAKKEDESTRVEITAVRHLRGFRGWLLAPVFPLGWAKDTVADHLRHFLSKVEERELALERSSTDIRPRPLTDPRRLRLNHSPTIGSGSFHSSGAELEPSSQ